MQPKIKITGQKELLRELQKFGEEAEKKVSSITQITANEIALNATQKAPKNFGKIAQSINVEPKTPGSLFYAVYVNAVPIAAYVEFGTGSFVDVAPEWKDMAWTFYKNGQGTLQPRPYLYPAYTRGKQQYEKDLQRLLELLTKKYSA